MEARIEQTSEAAVELLDAAERCLRRHGLSGFSTRRVAEEAEMPLSQIHYHFGSKQKLLLALLQHQNRKLLKRQAEMFAQPLPLSERWMQACDYLDEDLASGFVRVLQEMVAAGWSNPEIAAAVRETLHGWYDLLVRTAQEAEHEFGRPAGLSPVELATLVGHLFMGAESMIMLGMSERDWPIRPALRKIGVILRGLEIRIGGGGAR